MVIVLLTLTLHFAWEVAQSSLFLPMRSLPFWPAILLCARAAAGDLVITAIAFAAAAMSGAMHWPLRQRRRYPALIFLTIGILITIGYEIYALSAGLWAYAAQMPQLLGIGLTPLLQWIVIPLLEIAAFRVIWRRARISTGFPKEGLR